MASNGESPSSTSNATGSGRNKVALAPGHSLMDWIKLGLKEDLSGLGGRILKVTPEELEKHDSEEDAWICVKDMDYSLSPVDLMQFADNASPIFTPQRSPLLPKDQTKQSPLKCRFCSFTAKFASWVARHERTHTKEKPYSCSYCGSKFNRKDALTVHVITVHKGFGVEYSGSSQLTKE